MTQHNTCVGGEAMCLLRKTHKRMKAMAEVQNSAGMLAVWNTFAAKAKGLVDAAEDHWQRQYDRIEQYAEGEREFEEAKAEAGEEALAFVDRIFAGDLTPEDYHLALTKGWPVDLLKPRRISA